MCNIDERRRSVDVATLTRAFQDAVAVTRELGVRFLWIDSLCIIQPHSGCSHSHECSQHEDWDRESRKMDGYFGSAYCTIAATFAGDSSASLFRTRPTEPAVCVRAPNSAGLPLYVCEDFDKFPRDVNQAVLNRRGWVLQERALSRRTIHFTSTQAYWECGAEFQSEALTIMGSAIDGFLADSHFPSFIMGHPKIIRYLHARRLIELYSDREFTVPTDRSVAMFGLEKRLAKALETESRYGIFEGFLHRSLLWERAGDTRMRRITYPPYRKVPSWSWMAWEGKIFHMAISVGAVGWSSAICGNISPESLSNGCDQQLIAPAREFSLFQHNQGGMKDALIRRIRQIGS
ncbi:hypothetical protein BJX96DRAFT_8915 [Aspergillus floccosus]